MSKDSSLDQTENPRARDIDEILNNFWNGAMDCALSDDFKNEDDDSNIDKRQVYKNNLRLQARNAIEALYNQEEQDLSLANYMCMECNAKFYGYEEYMVHHETHITGELQV